jgi:hypothetical protein
MTLALLALCIWNIFLTFIAMRAMEQRDIARIKLMRLERRVVQDCPKLIGEIVERDAVYTEYGEDFHPV